MQLVKRKRKEGCHFFYHQVPSYGLSAGSSALFTVMTTSSVTSPFVSSGESRKNLTVFSALHTLSCTFKMTNTSIFTLFEIFPAFHEIIQNFELSLNVFYILLSALSRALISCRAAFLFASFKVLFWRSKKFNTKNANA